MRWFSRCGRRLAGGRSRKKAPRMAVFTLLGVSACSRPSILFATRRCDVVAPGQSILQRASELSPHMAPISGTLRVRRLSQQVGCHSAHQDPHLDFALAIVFTNCSRIKVTLCILHRQNHSLSTYSWLTLMRSPFGFPLVRRCQAQEFHTAAPAVWKTSPRVAPPILEGKTYLF